MSHEQTLKTALVLTVGGSLLPYYHMTSFSHPPVSQVCIRAYTVHL